jgi:hypothetical protein
MIQTLKQLWDLLTPRERRKFFLVLGMVMPMAALETAGGGVGHAVPVGAR